MGERPISQPGFAGTHTPEAKKRLAEDMPSPQGNAKEYHPGSWSHGAAFAARFEKHQRPTASPVEGTLTRALENYEDYYGLDRGKATVNDLRMSKHSLKAWAQYDLAELDDVQEAGSSAKRVGQIPYSTDSETWRADLASLMKYAFQDVENYREIAICENAAGDRTFRWGDGEYALGAVPQREDSTR